MPAEDAPPTPDLLARGMLAVHSLPHLRWRQLGFRAWRGVQRHLPVRVSADAASPDPGRFRALAREVATWQPEPAEAVIARAERILDGSFTFLDHPAHLPRVDWHTRQGSRLWSHHLHYFGYALDLARAWRATGQPRFASGFEVLADSWIAGNPPGRGDGWEPYPISVRTVHWLLARLVLGKALPPTAAAAMDRSVHQQLSVLERRLEYHVPGNHLQKNLAALALGGLYFDYQPARRWREYALPQLWLQLGEQVLPDGCHAERSPMYHALALADLLQLVALCDAARYPVAPAVRERLAAMAHALAILARPDGTLHLFNDAPDSQAPPAPWLRQLAARVTGAEAALPAGPIALPHAGYWGWLDDARGERLLIDCGPLGAEQQPGLGHCDMLSFELDVDGQAIVCDSGVSGCEPDALRAYVRSTRAHNTVTIDGREQHELWGTCRVARLGTPLFATHLQASDRWEFHGACAPYHAPRTAHHRVVRRQDGTWTVTDRVDGGEGRRLDSHIHLHPGCTLQREGDGFVVAAAAVRVRLETFGVDAVNVHQGESSPAQGWYCPEVGMALPAPVLRLTVNANHGREFGYRFTR